MSVRRGWWEYKKETNESKETNGTKESRNPWNLWLPWFLWFLIAVYTPSDFSSRRLHALQSASGYPLDRERVLYYP